MKTLILYKSKYGSTRQYANWIADEIPDSILKDLETITDTELEQTDMIIIGSYIYLGRIQALKFICAKWNILKSKHLYLFTVGMIPPQAKASLLTYNTIPDYIRTKIEYSQLPGTISQNKLTWIDRLIVKLIHSQKSHNSQTQTKYGQDNITPIINFINKHIR